MNSDYPYFIPHKGKYIGTEKCLWDQHVLVLGYSHHCGVCTIEECKSHLNPDCKKMTIDLVQDHIGGKDNNKNALYKFDEIMFSNIERPNRKQLWESISFYNFLQIAVPESSTDSHQFVGEFEEESFWEVLEELRPNSVIVWGNSEDTGLYNCLPGDFNDGRWIKYGSFFANGEEIKIDAIKLKNNQLIKVLPINHPSYHGKYMKSTKYWKNQIDEFLKL